MKRGTLIVISIIEGDDVSFHEEVKDPDVTASGRLASGNNSPDLSFVGGGAMAHKGLFLS
jgi:hypothetical protein